VVALTTEWLP